MLLKLVVPPFRKNCSCGEFGAWGTCVINSATSTLTFAHLLCGSGRLTPSRRDFIFRKHARQMFPKNTAYLEMIAQLRKRRDVASRIPR